MKTSKNMYMSTILIKTIFKKYINIMVRFCTLEIFRKFASFSQGKASI